jgi:hypothetical protein
VGDVDTHSAAVGKTGDILGNAVYSMVVEATIMHRGAKYLYSHFVLSAYHQF